MDWIWHAVFAIIFFIGLIFLNIGWSILIGKGCEIGFHDYSTGGYQDRDESGRVCKICCKCWHEEWFYLKDNNQPNG